MPDDRTALASQLLNLTKFAEARSLTFLRDWISSVYSRYNACILCDSARGAVEWYRLDRELLRRGTVDPQIVQLLTELNKWLSSQRGYPETLKGFLEQFWEAHKLDTYPSFWFSRVKPQVATDGVFAHISVLEFFPALKHIINQLKAEGHDTLPDHLVRAMAIDRVWDNISTPIGAHELSRMLSLYYQFDWRNSKGVLWFLDTDPVSKTLLSGLMNEDELVRVLHKTGFPSEWLKRTSFFPVRFVVILLPAKFIPNVALPCIWHGHELYWRPSEESTEGWNRAVDFNDFGEGFREGVSPCPIKWTQEFDIRPLGQLTGGLLEMQGKWCEYLKSSVFYGD